MLNPQADIDVDSEEDISSDDAGETFDTFDGVARLKRTWNAFREEYYSCSVDDEYERVFLNYDLH